MIDYKPTLTAQLGTILPTYYELFVDDDTATPCITYIEASNIDRTPSDGVSFSTLTYTIKLWGGQNSKLSELTPYLASIDDKMKELAFKRIGYNELVYNTQICFVLNYTATVIED